MQLFTVCGYATSDNLPLCTVLYYYTAWPGTGKLTISQIIILCNPPLMNNSPHATLFPLIIFFWKLTTYFTNEAWRIWLREYMPELMVIYANLNKSTFMINTPNYLLYASRPRRVNHFYFILHYVEINDHHFQEIICRHSIFIAHIIMIFISCTYFLTKYLYQYNRMRTGCAWVTKLIILP